MSPQHKDIKDILIDIMDDSHGLPWHGVDLDGTLAEYHGWTGKDEIGLPVPKMMKRVKKWLAAGEVVKIMTARVSGKPVGSSAHRSIAEWLIKHVGQVLPITNEKDFLMSDLWDDRAVQIIPNTGERADGKDSE